MVGLCKGLGILTVEGADRGPERRACLQDRSATAFFILLVIIALPVWLVSGRLGVISALRIPTSDLALAFSPLVAAFAITARREGWRAATKLLARAFDPTSMRGGRWNAAVVLIPPAVYATSWGVMRLVGSGAAMPDVALCDHALDDLQDGRRVGPGLPFARTQRSDRERHRGVGPLRGAALCAVSRH